MDPEDIYEATRPPPAELTASQIAWRAGRRRKQEKCRTALKKIIKPGTTTINPWPKTCKYDTYVGDRAVMQEIDGPVVSIKFHNKGRKPLSRRLTLARVYTAFVLAGRIKE